MNPFNRFVQQSHFELPFSQVEIGQAVGLTSIYVNKLLRQFVASGELEIERPYYRLLDRKSWIIDTEFVDAFGDIDTSWFPSPHAAQRFSSSNDRRRVLPAYNARYEMKELAI